MRKTLLPLTTAVMAGLVLSGCTPAEQENDPVEQSLPALSSDAPEGFAEYYEQPLNFEGCSREQVTLARMGAPKDLQNYLCAKVKAPLDWDDPASEAIELAVATYQKDPRSDLPRLFYNLGGPGGDAVQSLSAFATLIAPEALIDSFSLVAVDPRGVGASTPITCWDDAGRDEFFSESSNRSDLSVEEIVQLADEEMGALYEQCLEGSGDILHFADTDSVARDFDMIRALFGVETMDYLGYSYGTALGATYAQLFPEHVGRFVLDGALDPETNLNELSALQAGGMEGALYHWIETCQQSNDCPITGDLDSGKEQMKAFLEQLQDEPLPTGEPDRPLTAALARTGIVGSLYSPESYPLLETGMSMAQNGDGSVLLLLADFYNGREDDGTYNNSQDAFVAVNALDYEPVGTPEEWEQLAEQLSADYPVLGDQFGFASAGLAAWPAEARASREKVTAPGAPPIVVVGTTHDPATPYVMAESLSESLSSGVLVTYDGWGHGAYQQGGSKCLLEVVNAYLIDGITPQEGTVCN